MRPNKPQGMSRSEVPLMKIHPTTLLSGYVSHLRYKDLPYDVVGYTKLLVLDFLVSAMAGYKVNKVFNKAVLDVIGGMGGKPESTVLFGGGLLPAAQAGFINAVYGHGGDKEVQHQQLCIAYNVIGEVFVLKVAYIAA